MGGAVDWDVARTIAAKVAGREPYQAARYRDGLEEDFDRYTAMAEDLVAECTGLRSLAGNARGRVTNRAGWVDANLASFQRLLKPITTKLEEKMDGKESVIGPKFAGAELGAMLGWMSTRVLGQYDLLVIEDEKPEEQDIVYYVAPNVLMPNSAMRSHPRNSACGWRCTKSPIGPSSPAPWMRSTSSASSTPRWTPSIQTRRLPCGAAPARSSQAWRRSDGPGRHDGPVVPEEQLEVINEVAGLMSLLEGHGDITMDRAGKDLIPSQERFARVLRNRRQGERVHEGLPETRRSRGEDEAVRRG